MTKEDWIRHIEYESGLIRPSKSGNTFAWREEIKKHRQMGCTLCQERMKTRKHNAAARAREDAYRSCGLKKVIGSVSGSVYWE